MKSTEETKAAAKKAGIGNWWTKSEERLQEELGNTVTEVESPKVDFEELMDLLEGGTLGGALMSAKMNGEKSKFWKYRAYLEKKVNGN